MPHSLLKVDLEKLHAACSPDDKGVELWWVFMTVRPEPSVLSFLTSRNSKYRTVLRTPGCVIAALFLSIPPHLTSTLGPLGEFAAHLITWTDYPRDPTPSCQTLPPCLIIYMLLTHISSQRDLSHPQRCFHVITRIITEPALQLCGCALLSCTLSDWMLVARYFESRSILAFFFFF